MLGSHNSCTYLPCKHWWMYLINWAAKCQSKTLSEQFHAGVRYFDIRLKWNEKGRNLVIAHGLIEYKGSISRILETLNAFAKFYNEKVYVRFLLEYNKMPDDEACKILYFKQNVDYWRGHYPCLTYHLIETKWDEKVIEEYSKDIVLAHKYSSVLGWKRFLWIPYWYAKLHNKKTKELYKYIWDEKDNNIAVMLDFI